MYSYFCKIYLFLFFFTDSTFFGIDLIFGDLWIFLLHTEWRIGQFGINYTSSSELQLNSVFQNWTLKFAVDLVQTSSSIKNCSEISEINEIFRKYSYRSAIISIETNSFRAQINMYLSWSSYLSGDLEGALKYTKLVLEDEPWNSEAKENVPVYSWYVDNNLPCTFKETGEPSTFIRTSAHKKDVTRSVCHAELIGYSVGVTLSSLRSAFGLVIWSTSLG